MIVQLLQSFLQISQVIILCSNLEETALVFDWSDVIRSDLSCGFSSSDSPPPLVRQGQKMGRKDASATQLPVDQYRKQIGKSFVICEGCDQNHSINLETRLSFFYFIIYVSDQQKKKDLKSHY